MKNAAAYLLLLATLFSGSAFANGERARVAPSIICHSKDSKYSLTIKNIKAKKADIRTNLVDPMNFYSTKISRDSSSLSFTLKNGVSCDLKVVHEGTLSGSCGNGFTNLECKDFTSPEAKNGHL